MKTGFAAKALVALTLIVSVLPALPASASVVYSNFGAGDSYITNQGWTLTGRYFNGSDAGGTYNVACSFTPTSSYSLDRIELAIMNTKPDIHLNMLLQLLAITKGSNECRVLNLASAIYGPQATG